MKNSIGLTAVHRVKECSLGQHLHTGSLLPQIWQYFKQNFKKALKKKKGNVSLSAPPLPNYDLFAIQSTLKVK